MSTGFEPTSKDDVRPDATQAPGLPAEDQQTRERALRRFALRDRLLQVFDWLYPYAGRRRRGRHE